jgi:hypothetical protein
MLVFGITYTYIAAFLGFLEFCAAAIRSFPQALPCPAAGDAATQTIFAFQTYTHQYRAQACDELLFNAATICLRATKHSLSANWTTITLTHEDIAAAFGAYPNLKFSLETLPQHLCALFLVFLGTLSLYVLVAVIYWGGFVIISSVFTVVAAIIGT